MEIQSRIKEIQEYFQLCNIIEGFSYVLVKLPNRWVIPDKEYLEAEFSTQTANDKKGKGVYFFTNLENGLDCVFDAINCVIEFNKAIMEKMSLLNQKQEELKELFANESLDKLRTLRFEMDDSVEEYNESKDETISAPINEIKELKEIVNRGKDKKNKNKESNKETKENKESAVKTKTEETEEDVLESAKELLTQ